MTIDQEKIEQSLKNQNQDNSSNVADSLSDLMDHLSDEQKHKMFSELTNKEIKHISVLLTTGDDLMDDFIRHYMVTKVSRKRRGRKELLDVSESLSNVFGIEEGGGIREKVSNLV